MIWALLFFLGVPLWLCAVGIGALVLRHRALRRRPGNLPVRFRRSSATRWHRGNAVWVHDVFACRGAPAAWREELSGVTSVEVVDPDADVVHALRRLQPFTLVRLTCDDGTQLEVAAGKKYTEFLTGPTPSAAAVQNEPAQEPISPVRPDSSLPGLSRSPPTTPRPRSARSTARCPRSHVASAILTVPSDDVLCVGARRWNRSNAEATDG